MIVRVCIINIGVLSASILWDLLLTLHSVSCFAISFELRTFLDQHLDWLDSMHLSGSSSGRKSSLHLALHTTQLFCTSGADRVVYHSVCHKFVLCALLQLCRLSQQHLSWVFGCMCEQGLRSCAAAEGLL